MIRKLFRNLEQRFARRLGLLIRNMQEDLDASTLPSFANTPKNLHFESPRRISNAECIWIGDDVSLGPGCLLSATKQYPGSFMQGGTEGEVQNFEPEIRIGNRVSATAGLTIGAAQRVEIGDDALLASNIFISDNQHGHLDAERPFKFQPLDRIAPVSIGQGCWIGQNVVILPGVTVGEMSIVGANSVVAESIPPRSIAVGAPARVVRVWDDQAGAWSKP
jgi:acetyltransferase-like isoleucine patch superfamily enzyme